MGWYFPSATANSPDDEPSTNSIAGGSRALKASISFAGRYWSRSLLPMKVEVGRIGAASILTGPSLRKPLRHALQSSRIESTTVNPVRVSGREGGTVYRLEGKCTASCEAASQGNLRALIYSGTQALLVCSYLCLYSRDAITATRIYGRCGCRGLISTSAQRRIRAGLNGRIAFESSRCIACLSSEEKFGGTELQVHRIGTASKKTVTKIIAIQRVSSSYGMVSEPKCPRKKSFSIAWPALLGIHQRHR